MFSFPVGTERFHFPTLPFLQLCIYYRIVGHNSNRVTPFGNLRIKARLTATRSLSQPTTSFIGLLHQGIHRMPFVRLIEILFYSVLNVQLQMYRISLFSIVWPTSSAQYANTFGTRESKLLTSFPVKMDLRRVELLTF